MNMVIINFPITVFFVREQIGMFLFDGEFMIVQDVVDTVWSVCRCVVVVV